MLKTIQQRDKDGKRWVKIAMTVFLGLICLSMLTYLIPGLMTGSADTTNPDAVASINGRAITVDDFQREFNQATQNQAVPAMMRSIYAQQILDQMIFQQALDYEATRLGLQVTPEEQTERLKAILPTAWVGGVWQKDRYVDEVEQRTGMSVPQFESAIRDDMLQQKFRQLITDGITVSPAEVAQEFRWRNEKVAIEYALIKPSDLAGTIHPSDAELSAWFSKNGAHYQIPEKRSGRYALLDLAKLRATTQVSDDALRTYYIANINQYKVENRVHVEHILFKTVGKTDAEIAEIRKKAEDVLKQAKHGANFEDLAKKYSEDDATKPKGGDLGWIVEGQTVPEFQQAAFSLPKGAISDLVKTQYGFHIIKVLDHEDAHTKSFEEVRDSILQPMLDEKVNQEANNISDQMAAAVRQSDRQSLDDLAKKFNLQVGDISPVTVTEPVGPLGNAPTLHQALFELNPGELSQPIQIESGFAIVTVKDSLPAHQASLSEVHDQVLADYQKEKSVELAQQRAQELAKRTQGGESFDQAAKALGLALKTSDPFARSGSVPDVGTGKQLEAAFDMPIGQVSQATKVEDSWVVYRIASHDAPDLTDLAKQKDTIEQQLLQTKQNAAFEAFHTALVNRLEKEGKLTINSDAVNRLTHPAS
ncbi:MAG TPA: peptidylprolyl isomerase [Candidatus Acidoferrales bacterium]|jgi:peptidyl-prolyl cis-trans isomerase D|nr:peptidylprolyl isomerase [Candidatus Acidoferrales bacterium]